MYCTSQHHTQQSEARAPKIWPCGHNCEAGEDATLLRPVAKMQVNKNRNHEHPLRLKCISVSIGVRLLHFVSASIKNTNARKVTRYLDYSSTLLSEGEKSRIRVKSQYVTKR